MGNLSCAAVLAEKGQSPPSAPSVIAVIRVIHGQVASVNSRLHFFLSFFPSFSFFFFSLFFFFYFFLFFFFIALRCEVRPFFYVGHVCGQKLEAGALVGGWGRLGGAALFCFSCELVCISAFQPGTALTVQDSWPADRTGEGASE